MIEVEPEAKVIYFVDCWKGDILKEALSEGKVTNKKTFAQTMQLES